jgi:hypothetical protein
MSCHVAIFEPDVERRSYLGLGSFYALGRDEDGDGDGEKDEDGNDGRETDESSESSISLFFFFGLFSAASHGYIVILS